MKKSNRVMLAAIFLAAIATARAKGQELYTSYKDMGHPDDTVRFRRNTWYGHPYVHFYHGSFSIFRPHRAAPPPAAPPPAPIAQTYAPRTHGFGNTMRRSSATVHS